MLPLVTATQVLNPGFQRPAWKTVKGCGIYGRKEGIFGFVMWKLVQYSLWIYKSLSFLGEQIKEAYQDLSYEKWIFPTVWETSQFCH